MKIGNVKFDLSYYTNEDFYSDGDIELEILEMVKNDFNIDGIIKSDNRWPVLYHLSPARRNLLESFEFPAKSSVLEIGAGCGGITSVLCDKFDSVTSIELSKRRAEILAHRNKNRENLEVIVGNLNDIELDKKFDFVTLIGVLEYAGKYTEGREPYKDFLLATRELLNENGQLIIAIENKFGLKYWAGFREDHLGTYFTGLEGYDEKLGLCTFSKKELGDLVSSAGFEVQKFYYPMPDYKFPTKIFSDDYKLFMHELDTRFRNFDADRVKLFDEMSVLKNIAQNDKFDFFANSFLVFAKKEG